jgi:hypothetical protein
VYSTTTNPILGRLKGDTGRLALTAYGYGSRSRARVDQAWSGYWLASVSGANVANAELADAPVTGLDVSVSYNAFVANVLYSEHTPVSTVDGFGEYVEHYEIGVPLSVLALPLSESNPIRLGSITMDLSGVDLSEDLEIEADSGGYRITHPSPPTEYGQEYLVTVAADCVDTIGVTVSTSWPFVTFGARFGRTTGLIEGFVAGVQSTLAVVEAVIIGLTETFALLEGVTNKIGLPEHTAALLEGTVGAPVSILDYELAILEGRITLEVTQLVAAIAVLVGSPETALAMLGVEVADPEGIAGEAKIGFQVTADASFAALGAALDVVLPASQPAAVVGVVAGELEQLNTGIGVQVEGASSAGLITIESPTEAFRRATGEEGDE